MRSRGSACHCRRAQQQALGELHDLSQSSGQIASTAGSLIGQITGSPGVGTIAGLISNLFNGPPENYQAEVLVSGGPIPHVAQNASDWAAIAGSPPSGGVYLDQNGVLLISGKQEPQTAQAAAVAGQMLQAAVNYAVSQGYTFPNAAAMTLSVQASQPSCLFIHPIPFGKVSSPSTCVGPFNPQGLAQAAWQYLQGQMVAGSNVVTPTAPGTVPPPSGTYPPVTGSSPLYSSAAPGWSGSSGMVLPSSSIGSMLSADASGLMNWVQANPLLAGGGLLLLLLLSHRSNDSGGYYRRRK